MCLQVLRWRCVDVSDRKKEALGEQVRTRHPKTLSRGKTLISKLTECLARRTGNSAMGTRSMSGWVDWSWYQVIVESGGDEGATKTGAHTLSTSDNRTCRCPEKSIPHPRLPQSAPVRPVGHHQLGLHSRAVDNHPRMGTGRCPLWQVQTNKPIATSSMSPFS